MTIETNYTTHTLNDFFKEKRGELKNRPGILNKIEILRTRTISLGYTHVAHSRLGESNVQKIDTTLYLTGEFDFSKMRVLDELIQKINKREAPKIQEEEKTAPSEKKQKRRSPSAETETSSPSLSSNEPTPPPPVVRSILGFMRQRTQELNSQYQQTLFAPEPPDPNS